jgi:hypothetical protein
MDRAGSLVVFDWMVEWAGRGGKIGGAIGVGCDDVGSIKLGFIWELTDMQACFKAALSGWARACFHGLVVNQQAHL